MKDCVKAMGLVSIYRNGVLEQQQNLVLKLGKQWIAKRCTGQDSTLATHIGAGTGTTPTADAQLALVTEVARVPLVQAGAVNPGTATMRFEAVFPAGVATGPLTEAGLFNAASGGLCIARTVFDVKNKGSEDVFTVVWEITIS
ncbi:MAG: hypothetical protein ACRCVV_12520 [Shewanella sp.]